MIYQCVSRLATRSCLLRTASAHPPGHLHLRLAKCVFWWIAGVSPAGRRWCQRCVCATVWWRKSARWTAATLWSATAWLWSGRPRESWRRPTTASDCWSGCTACRACLRGCASSWRLTERAQVRESIVIVCVYAFPSVECHLFPSRKLSLPPLQTRASPLAERKVCFVFVFRILRFLFACLLSSIQWFGLVVKIPIHLGHDSQGMCL